MFKEILYIFIFKQKFILFHKSDWLRFSCNILLASPQELLHRLLLAFLIVSHGRGPKTLVSSSTNFTAFVLQIADFYAEINGRSNFKYF